MTTSGDLANIRGSINNVYQALQAQIDYLAAKLDTIEGLPGVTSAVDIGNMLDESETLVRLLREEVEDRLVGIEVRLTNIETEDGFIPEAPDGEGHEETEPAESDSGESAGDTTARQRSRRASDA